MLSIDQVKLLESKVAGAIELIKNLSDEKDLLKKDLEAKDKRIAELETLLLNFKEDQSQIEEKVINALNQLSAFEDSVYEKKSDAQTPVNNNEHSSDLPNNASVNDNNPQESNGLKEKMEASNNNAQNHLQKDLNDVLGYSSEENTTDEADEESDKQLDIF